MKLNERQIKRFTEIFEIKAKSIILIEKENVVTIVINSVIIFDVSKELFYKFLWFFNILSHWIKNHILEWKMCTFIPFYVIIIDVFRGLYEKN